MGNRQGCEGGRKKGKTARQKEALAAYMFLLPSLLGTAVFVLLPYLDVVRRSFFKAAGLQFTGLDHYQAVLQNKAFQNAIVNNARFLCICLPLLLCLSFLFAVLIYRIPFFGTFWKAGFLLPMAVPVASVAVFWRLLFHSQGILNEVLSLLKVSGKDWMNTEAAFWVLILTYLWRNLGYDIILFLAGLTEIPAEQYEAARTCGAGGFSCFWYITLPQMKSSIAMITVLSMINAFRVFREAYLIAGDYPHERIYMLQHLFNHWLQKLDIQKMSAGAVMISIGVGIFLFLLELWNRETKVLKKDG